MERVIKRRGDERGEISAVGEQELSEELCLLEGRYRGSLLL